MKTGRLLLTLCLGSLVLFWGSLPARADCQYNGQSYQEGDRVGGFVCQGGQWVDG